VVITDHTNVDYSAMLDSAKLVVDTRNALKKLQSDKLVRL
jgi:UDP-N-acetyl-D-glucosamine dehydrogenase